MLTLLFKQTRVLLGYSKRFQKEWGGNGLQKLLRYSAGNKCVGFSCPACSWPGAAGQQPYKKKTVACLPRMKVHVFFARIKGMDLEDPCSKCEATTYLSCFSRSFKFSAWRLLDLSELHLYPAFFLPWNSKWCIEGPGTLH